MSCLEAKINEHYKTWRSHAIGLTRNRDEADELLHDVLDSMLTSEVAQKIACCEDRIYFYVNRSIWLRHWTRQRQRKSIYLEERKVEPEFEVTEYHVEGEHLDILVHWLTEYERELILAYGTKGFEITEAARQLGMNYRTIKKDLAKAINQIKKYVEDSRVTEDN